MTFRRLTNWGGGYAFAAAAVAIVSVVLAQFRSVLAPTTVMLFYVPLIVGIARLEGVRASATAAVLSFLALDLIFIPPYYHLNVAALPEWIALVVFLIVALVAGQQTGTLRQRQQSAIRRQNELELLNNLSFRIASEKSAASTAQFMVAEVLDVLHARRAALYVRSPEDATPQCIAQTGSSTPASGEVALVSWVLKEGKAVGLDETTSVPADQRPATVGAADAIPGVTAEGAFVPLQTVDSLEGVLVAVPQEDSPMTADDDRLLAAVANLGAVSLQRHRLEDEAAAAQAIQEADRLKATLVSSVSHELKTPLAAATAHVTGLLEEGPNVDGSRVHEELRDVAEDLERLNSSIGALLDLSRLESDSWRARPESYDVSEVLGTVLSRFHVAQRERVRFEIADQSLDVMVDFAQIARAVTVLVENALAYSGVKEPVIVGAARRGDAVEIWVQDHGPGIADNEKEQVFEKFYRGAASANVPGGTGLGLAIAREIVRSHGGRLWVEDVQPHGARFVMMLPAWEGSPG
jgi:two-component system, OmpR family, sensor histidine kinase KdpD